MKRNLLPQWSRCWEALRHMETTPENHKQIKWRVVGQHPKGFLYKILLHLRLRTLKKREWKDGKSQDQEVSCRVYLLGMPEAPCLHMSWTRTGSKRHAKGGREKSKKPHWVRLGAEEVLFPLREHSNWFSSAKWSAMKTYKEHDDMGWSVFFYIHTYTHSCIYTCSNSAKKRDCIRKAGRGMYKGLEGERGRENVLGKL